MSIGQFWRQRQRALDYLRHPARTGSPAQPHQPDAERINRPAARTLTAIVFVRRALSLIEVYCSVATGLVARRRSASVIRQSEPARGAVGAMVPGAGFFGRVNLGGRLRVGDP